MMKIEPCPFCGGTDIRFDKNVGAGRAMLHRGQDVWSMCCYDCGATFPNMYNREGLERKWNRRTPPASQSDEALVEKIVVEFSDKAILLLDIDEESPVLSRLCDEMREWLPHHLCGVDRMRFCETCQGNGEIVTDWERYLHGPLDENGDDAVADCPDCDGRGEHE